MERPGHAADEFGILRHKLNNSLIPLVTLSSFMRLGGYGDAHHLENLERETDKLRITLGRSNQSHLARPSKLLTVIEQRLARIAPLLRPLEKEEITLNPRFGKYIRSAAVSYADSLELIREYLRKRL